MKKFIIGFIAAVILIGAGAFIGWTIMKDSDIEISDVITRLEKLSGTQKIMLAEQQVYHEYKVKANKYNKKLNIHADVLMRWIATYQYLIDLQKQQLKFSIKQPALDKELVIDVVSPAIELNEPIIDIKTYKPIVLNPSIFINEQKVINGELRTLTGKSKEFGNKFITEEKIQNLCREELRDFLFKMISGLGLKVQEINVEFKSS